MFVTSCSYFVKRVLEKNIQITLIKALTVHSNDGLVETATFVDENGRMNRTDRSAMKINSDDDDFIVKQA